MNGCGSANGWSTTIRSTSSSTASSKGALLAVLDDQAAGGGAALAGREIGRLDDHDRRRGDILGLPHDQRAVAAQLEREDLVGHVGELAVERHAGARGAGEQQAVDARLGGQRLPFLGAADQQPDGAFGNLRLVKAVDQEFAGRGGLFRRLEHHCIAGDQRRDDVAVGQMHREIVRPQHRQHAVRLVAHRDAVAERGLELALRRALGIGLDRNLDLVDHRRDLGPRFPIRLAGFLRDQLGEFILALADDIGEAAHGLDPVSDRMRRPGRPARARRLDLEVGIADRAGPDFLARRRVGRDQRCSPRPSGFTTGACSSSCRCIGFSSPPPSGERL